MLPSGDNGIGARGNSVDRKIGEFWEDAFVRLAKDYGWEAWCYARKRGPKFEHNGQTYISPDVWILRRGDCQYACEIKHKQPARNNCYGLEKYRSDSLLKLQDAYHNQFGTVTALYVIHDWALAGGFARIENDVEHWRVQRLDHLRGYLSRCQTYFASNVTTMPVPIWYYNTTQFSPLVEILLPDNGPDVDEIPFV